MPAGTVIFVKSSNVLFVLLFVRAENVTVVALALLKDKPDVVLATYEY